MKRIFLVAAIVTCVAGASMAQNNPAKKKSPATAKTEVRKDSVGSATASTMNKHKVHKKGAHKKS
ncbi:MAG: hypothetical protein JNK79_07245 [Chitinophagaceae bacterium]|nr:hypothetical protein [Chitinophagaceae bacterium]